jgi:ribosomal protein S18 acetylase RimI-like enzyme
VAAARTEAPAVAASCLSAADHGSQCEGRELRLTNPAQLELLRGMAERGVPLRTAVRGSSMAPFIRDADRVTIVPMRIGPEVGDVVAVALGDGERMVLHRVVARRPDGWLVRGDNCSAFDGVFQRHAILGRVARVERGGRDVRCGLGAQGAWVAALSRSGWLERGMQARSAVRWSVVRGLTAAQGTALYRRAGRGLAPGYVIGRITTEEAAAVQRRLDPSVAAGRVAETPGATCLVARLRGRVIGFGELVVQPAGVAARGGFWLFSLTVWAPWRGLGVGEALVRALLESARVRGASEVCLLVGEDNVRSISLYRKVGFITVPGHPDEVTETLVAGGPHSSLIVMRRVLRAEARRGAGRVPS